MKYLIIIGVCSGMIVWLCLLFERMSFRYFMSYLISIMTM